MLALFDSLRHWLDGIAHLGTILAVAYLLYLFALAGWIMLQKREPVATLSWILSLALLPYLGLFIYYLLGPQKVKRQRLRRGRARSGMEHTAMSAARFGLHRAGWLPRPPPDWRPAVPPR